MPIEPYFVPDPLFEMTQSQHQPLSAQWGLHSNQLDYAMGDDGIDDSDGTSSNQAGQEVFSCEIGDCTKRYTCRRSLVRE